MPEPGCSVAGGSDLAALERFVVENDDLLALESMIGRFNVFDALRIARAEIRHSNFLAFLLDPMESHGQGQLFLKAILMDLLKRSPPELRPLSPIEIDGTDLRGVEVWREWNHIDLLITCKEPQFAVCVENKVDSKEHSNQLQRYQSVMARNYPSVRTLFVFLTPEFDEASDPNWVPYGYKDIHRVLHRVEETYRNGIGEDIRVFLNHYLSLIGNRFMDNPQIDELCRRIYTNHRQALDLIFERAATPAAGVFSEVAGAVSEDKRWHVFSSSNSYVEFVPKSWIEWLPPIGVKEDRRWWIMLRIGLNDGKLWYSLVMDQTRDLGKRRELVTALQSAIPNCGLKRSNAKEVKDRRSRISASERILTWSDDEEPAAETIRAEVGKTLNELNSKMERVAAVLKPLVT